MSLPVPLLSLPGAPPLLSSSVLRLWSLGCCGPRAGLGRDGGWAGLGRAGLGRAGLGWAGLGGARLGGARLGGARQGGMRWSEGVG